MLDAYPDFDAFLIDMVIGLRNNDEQVRPDDAAKKELGRKGSSVFPIPARDAVYANGEEEQKQINIRILGKSLAKQTTAIIPKIRELDEFLNDHPKYKNKILESHPELNFARLNGSPVMSRKQEYFGLTEREEVLSEYLGIRSLSLLCYEKAKELKCSPDDVMDAICLAVTGALYAHGQCETIPEKPEKDERGLYMQLTAPKRRIR